MRSADRRHAPPIVLVVEDEVIIQMMLTEALQGAGLDVLEADSADAAVQAFATGAQIEVVITDVRMPGSMDGLGLACWMRVNAPGVPIIITSGFASQPEITAGNPAIARVVVKPYDPSEVASWVCALIEDTDAPRAS